MATKNVPATELSATAAPSTGENVNSTLNRIVQRRSFLKTAGIAGATLAASGLLAVNLRAQQAVEPEDEGSGSLTAGDAAILRFLAAAEIIESDLWLQYAELGGVQDNELPALASQLIPGYPAQPTGGNPGYTAALKQLDGDMDQYIHDNTEDELSHEVFINAYLASKGADTVNLDRFRTLPSSKATGATRLGRLPTRTHFTLGPPGSFRPLANRKATGANQFGRLTNLTQLTVDTSWWTRYRSRTGNPDFGDSFPQAIPSLALGQHTAIPRSNRDLATAVFSQAIANTAGFHFAFIEQGGSSLYPQLAQRVRSVEVLRILLSIGGTEITHFQTWHDKAGNAPNVTNVADPVTGVKVSFPNLNSSPFGGEDFQTNLIMPEPTVFLRKQFPAVSIIRPTNTQGAAMGALRGLTADGLFIGQSTEFFGYLRDLAEDADEAQRANAG